MPSPEDLVWQLMLKGATMPFKVASHMIRAGARAGSNASARSAARLPYAVRRTGLLAPGDPPPAPGADLMDYRGVAGPHDVGPLLGAPIPLGFHFDPRRGPGPQIGVTPDMLFRHAAVVGPPGSGKTYSLVVPWIVNLLRTGASVVTIDVKGDLRTNIQRHAAATGGPTGASLHVCSRATATGHRGNGQEGDHRRQPGSVTITVSRRRRTDLQHDRADRCRGSAEGPARSALWLLGPTPDR